MKKLDYASLFTLRKDGRYMGYWHDERGARHAIYARDPEKLYETIQARESGSAIKELTFAQASVMWERAHEQRVGYSTMYNYQAPLRRANAVFGSMKLSEITPPMIYAYLQDLARKKYARRTVQTHKTVIQETFREAIFNGYATSDPCAVVHLPRDLKTTKRAIPDDDALYAVKTMTDHPFSLFANICLYAGLRRGEALALRYEDIDREKKVIHVTRAVEYIDNATKIKKPKTEAGVRDAVLLDVLAAKIPAKKKGLLFHDKDGRPWTKAQYQKGWKSYQKYIGHEITAHQLRHGFATILYEAGIQDKDAQALLGHTKIELTRNVYTHIRDSRRNETASKLNSFLQDHF